jgi:predicted nucleotidyltransferase
MTQFEKLLHLLSGAGVEFIVVGGVAAAAHGAARTTLDLDVVYSRTQENLSRMVAALSGINPYPRGAPPGLPFRWDVRTLQFGTNFTLTTSLGYVDLLGEITGGGTYEDLQPFTVQLEVFGISCQCIDLSKLIEVKTAAGRPKDFEAVTELKVIQEERKHTRGAGE